MKQLDLIIILCRVLFACVNELKRKKQEICEPKFGYLILCVLPLQKN